MFNLTHKYDAQRLTSNFKFSRNVPRPLNLAKRGKTNLSWCTFGRECCSLKDTCLH